MFIVLLRFSENKSRVGQLMKGHNEWIRRGFDDGVFSLVGGLRPDAGGAVLAHNISLADLRTRVDSDPLVAQKVVDAEILEITPSRTDERLKFLVG